MVELKITGLKSETQLDNSFVNAMGGTELMQKWLFENVKPEWKDKFQIIASRVRDLDDKPKIFWVHDLSQDPEVEFLKDPEERKQFEKIVFVSHWQQEKYMLHLGVPYEEGVVLQNAIYPIPEHEKPKSKKLKLIYTSTPHRGLAVLLRAFEILNRDDVELDVFSSFKIYNRPQMDEQFQDLYNYASNMKGVNYYGTVSNDKIREALQQAHIFTYPSVYQETSCIAAIEAMSASCLVITNNLGALPETCANFAWMYNFERNMESHAMRFAHVLNNAIDTYWDESIQHNLKYQKSYFDLFYNWELRGLQWENFFESVWENYLHKNGHNENHK